MTTALATVLRAIDGWGASNAAGAVVGPDGVIAEHGDTQRRFGWASISKLAVALASLIAVDRGDVDLDEPAGPPGATLRHLLAHASGLPFDGATVLASPGRRRIYSNTGYDALGGLLSERAGQPFDGVLRRDVLEPLGMRATVLLGRPSRDVHGPLVDLSALALELLRPTLVTPSTAQAMRSVAFPGLVGVLPGVGRFDPLDWGLGPELRADKHPHWTGKSNSPSTFGHFGGSGTFLWVDPVVDRALICLTDRTFDAWALTAWPDLSDAVIEAM